MDAAMNLLFTSRSTKAGSWRIRGGQLGAACGAAVIPRATLAQCKAAAAIVVVKKVDAELLAAVRASDRPWAFDVLDAYPQPLCANWGRGESIDWIRNHIRQLAPTAVIWPNRKMREECDTGLPGIVLPHHYRPGIAANPVRERVRTVGYEGEPAYLAGMRGVIEDECARRGWRFVVNPPQLADVDIVLAVRAGLGMSYAARHWKSNVKLANAHGSGTPFIGNRECGYLETASGCEYWADSPRELVVAMDWLESQGARELISDRFRSVAFPVERAAEQLLGFLRGM
jgi:hypothetical protein